MRFPLIFIDDFYQSQVLVSMTSKLWFNFIAKQQGTLALMFAEENGCENKKSRLICVFTRKVDSKTHMNEYKSV